MRVFVTPDRIELGPEGTVEVLITVHNTGTLIGGFLGAHVGRKLSPALLRSVIVVLGVIALWVLLS